MKITFQNQTVNTMETADGLKRASVGGTARSTAGQRSSVHYEAGTAFAEVDNGKGKSVLQLQQEAAVTDVGIRQDYMTLMSNTMSEEDYARLQEEGFDFGSMDPGEAVTIVDRIKAELARSGKKIVGYTDDIDMETLAAALGSQTLARTVADSFREADLPLTEENLSALAQAWSMSEGLKEPGEGSLRYLIDNGLEPDIRNLYMAQSCGAAAGNAGLPAYYAEEIQGYYTKSGQNETDSGFAGQIDRVIQRAGMQPDEESRQDAAWLLENGLPLTEENLQKLGELKDIVFPITAEDFGRAAALAVEQGKSPVQAKPAGNEEGIYEKAVRWEAYYQGEEIWEACEGNVTARRQLEEIRLRMTAETNVKLLKSGFSIDTSSMEALIDALKLAERELAEQYFPEAGDALEKYADYRTAEHVIKELPALPAQVIGSFAGRQDGGTLETFHAEGKSLQAAYRKAGESYETLMTEPRRDLGDHIQKAFANVDDILEDLELALTEENRRAARILGYNRMEMTVENLEKVREADGQVKQIIEKLTPAAVLKLIRDGVNPLEKSFDELENYFETLPEDYRKASESYSRFLYGLERNQEITEKERESYIGIFRLVRQIEKTDGAAVGALVNSQAELHFSNLLSAVRSGKAKRLDTKIGDEAGALSRLLQDGGSISEQISRAFTERVGEAVREVSYDGAAQEAYNSEQLARYREALASADSECTAMLQRGEIPAGADHLLAAAALLSGEEELFGEKSVNREKEVLWERLDSPEEFVRLYADALSEARETVETETFGNLESSVDVRHMQLKHKQLTIAGGLVKEQEFFLPVEIGGQTARVHLRLAHASDGAGMVEISILTGTRKGLCAELGFSDGRLNGILKNRAEEVMETEKTADIFKQEAGESWTLGNISVVTTDVRAAAGRGMDAGTENRELYRVAKVFLHAVQQGEMTDEN